MTENNKLRYEKSKIVNKKFLTLKKLYLQKNEGK